ncbi:MAG: M55 family metallopeptidase [Victivallaceae bacterium]|nr:M55 family metallopeptidase [Victivallaceae bacterium]
MKIIILTDIEGVAGICSSPEQTSSSGKYYEESKRLLTQEVNAAVDGLLDAGVNDILVFDGHGPGGINFEILHPEAKLLHGRPLVPWNVLREVLQEYDATMIIGQHAMAGVRDGNLNHTQSSKSIYYYKLNGRPIGELAQWALYCGALGIALIFLSGDEAACREAEDFVEGINTAAVKKGLGRNSALTLSAVKAREKIRLGACAAVKKHLANPVKPLVWKPPFVLEKRFFQTDAADSFMDDPDYTVIDSRTVQRQSDNILDLIYD